MNSLRSHYCQYGLLYTLNQCSQVIDSMIKRHQEKDILLINDVTDKKQACVIQKMAGQ
jgi:hypothetical protein